MPTRLNSTTDIYRLNEADVLGNSKDDTTSGNAGRIPQVNPDIGNATTIVAVDGNLSSITVGTTDPLANSAGVSSTKWSIAALMRWLISEVRRTATIGATAVNQIDASTTGNITAVDAGSTSNTVSATGQTLITGTPTANSFVTAALNACSTFTVQLTGTFVATAAFESSIDGGITWVPINLILRNVGTSMGSATTIGVWRGAAAGLTNVRVRCTAFASGAISATIVTAKGVENVFVGNGVKAAAFTSADASGTTSGTANTYTQVSAASVANRNYVRIANPLFTDAGASNGTVITVGIGAASSETILDHLNPGDSIQYTGSDRIAVKSILSASAIYKAQVAIYS